MIYWYLHFKSSYHYNMFFLTIIFGLTNGHLFPPPPPQPSNQFLSSSLNDIIDWNKRIYSINLDLPLEKPLIRIEWSSETTWFKVEKSEVCIIDLKELNLSEVLGNLRKNPLISFAGLFIILTEKISPELLAAASEFYLDDLIIIDYEKIHYKSSRNSKRFDSTIQVLNNIIPPYVICPNCPSNKGIEIEAFDIVASHLGIKVNYTRSEFEYWGQKVNGSYTNLLGELEKHNGDMGIGVFHSKFFEHLDFDITYTYMEDGTRWLVPRAGILPYWKRIGLIFSREVYLAIFASVLAVMIACHLLYNISYSSTWVLFYQILLEASLSKLPAFRIVLIVWTGCCLILSTMFKSKLIDTMSKNSYEHQIDSLSDIVASKLHIVIDHDIAKFYDYHTNSDEEYVRNNYEFCTNPRICINRTAFEQDCVTIDFQRSNEFFLPQFVKPSGEILLHLFKSPVFPVHIHIFFVKGHPIFQKVDQSLMRLRSSGIITHLYDKAGHNAKLAMSGRVSFKAEVLGLEQMQIAFLVWAVGVIVSILVFLLESLGNLLRPKPRDF